MANPLLLFADAELTNRLEHLWQQAHKRLLDWKADDLLARSDYDLIDSLLSTSTIECPTLTVTEAHLLDPSEATVRRRTYGDVYERRLTRFTLVVPFDGDPEVFKMKASTYNHNPPEGQIRERDLLLFCYNDGGDAAQVKHAFDELLNRIGRCLDWSRGDIERHNARMKNEIPTVVANRRAKLLADRELQANIGFPVKRRADASAYAVPLRRRHVEPRRGSTPPFQPEPALADQDYEAALSVLCNMRNALERSPTTAIRLGEEEIRDLLLVNLNAQFEGKAAGEVFNGAGKTDILIRVDDRNVFIGECKIWKGPKTVADALDQLLGYLVWRDTKAALLLFIRAADVSAITAKAVAKVEEHPNFKRRGKIWKEERYDFVLHANGDEAREIKLALLPFLVSGGN